MPALNLRTLLSFRGSAATVGIRVLPFGKTDCHDQFANRSRNDKFFSLFYCQAAGEVFLRLY